MRRPGGEADLLAHELRDALADAAPEAGEHPSEAQLARYLSRELDESEVERFERHVAACASCAEELALAAAVEDEARVATATAGATAAAPEAARRAASEREEIAAAVRAARVERTLPRRRRRTWLRVAAALVLVLGSLLALRAGSELLLERLEPLVFERLASTLGRKVTSEGTSLVLAGGPGLRIEGLAIAESPEFGGGDFMRIAGTTLRLDAGALLSGKVRGEVHLDAPSVQLVRDAAGRWNVETLAGLGASRARSGERRTSGDDAPGDRARRGEHKERAVRLTSASVSAATLTIDDRASGARPLVLRDVDGRYASPDPRAAGVIQLEGTIGASGGSFAVEGEIGPFEGGAQPRYRFAELAVQRLPLAEVPGAPANVRGELTFRGSITTEGAGAEALVMKASGGGELGLCCGELRERNLTLALVGAMAREAAAADPTRASEILTRAAQSPALASALAQRATPFDDIAGEVAIADGTLTFESLAVATPLFAGEATGSVSRAGALEAYGSVTLAAPATTAIVQVFPEARQLFGDGAELVVPFTVAGTWPDVTVQIDVRSAIARLTREHDPRSLVLGRLLFG